MKLQRPDILSLLTFCTLVGIAALISILHAYLEILKVDRSSIEWMNIFSSTAGITALGILGAGTIRKNGS